MERTERFYKMLSLIRVKGWVSRERLLEYLGDPSPATFKRDLEYMRSRMNVPIDWDRERRGYRIDPAALAKGLAELPGLWFSAEEAHALFTMYHLLSSLEPGLLESQIAPIKERIEKLMATRPGKSSEMVKRVRVIQMAGRPVPTRYFSAIARAVLERKQVHIAYYNRERNYETKRDISPQRLTHYRDNWYVDAWCHMRKDIRCFSVDAIRSVELLDTKAKDIAEADLDRELASSYGIFTGQPKATAKLRFTAARARWVSRESWHPKQQGTFDSSGRYTLEVPDRDDRELIMDILRHGPEVEVIEPPELRRRLGDAAARTAAQYR
jgi:predicted DNA-binding transcriptional regulator YafY